MPLDGSGEAFEEVLDPDFGEAAIGRVAPVDSGNLAILQVKVSLALHCHFHRNKYERIIVCIFSQFIT